MTKWIETTLGDVAKFSNGRKPEFSKIGCFPVFGANGSYGLSEVSNAEKSEIIIGRVGAYCGSLYYLDNKAWVTDNAIRCQPSVNSDFLFYYLKTVDLNRMAGGAAQPLLNQVILSQVPITIPEDIKEQERIAGILSCLDDKIELLQSQNKTLEDIAQTIFTKTFITNPNPDWEEEGLSENINFLNGAALQKYPTKNQKEYLPVIKIAELKGGITTKTNKASIDIPKEYVVKNGDFLFSWSASLFLTIWGGGKGALNQHLFKVTSAKYSKPFCYQWVNYHLPWFKMIASSKAVTMGHIKRCHLDEAKLKVPDEKTMKEFNSQVKPMFDKISANIKQISTLTETRDTLLPKLITGKIKVKK